jgi:hypothetical protein
MKVEIDEGRLGLPGWAVGVSASLAVVALFFRWMALPTIRYDDFNFLTHSRTWSRAFDSLWQPMNDHAMPLCRLAAAVLMQLAPGQSSIPRLAQAQGPAAVVLGMWLLYLFVRRELRHPVYGLIAMVLWGVTSAYIQSVTWYSGSFFILSLDTMLLAFLAAQAWERTGRWLHLALCVAWCSLAPAWFGGGILVGVLCTCYLLGAPSQAPGGAVPASRGAGPGWPPAAARLPAFVPLMGSALFLAVSLPRTAAKIVHASHYQGKTVFQAFDVVSGAESTIRTLADNQVLGAIGVYRASAFAWPAALVLAGLFVGLGVLWWRLAWNRRLLVLGVAIILASDLLTYSARADWSYERTVHTWTRYHLFPHLGLVLFVAGGLPRFLAHRLTKATEGIGRREMAILLALVAAAFAVHVSRAYRSHFYFPQQAAVLKRVERTDTYCRALGISGDTARQALGFLAFPLGYADDNAWDFLRGSPDPRPLTVEEAGRLLNR